MKKARDVRVGRCQDVIENVPEFKKVFHEIKSLFRFEITNDIKTVLLQHCRDTTNIVHYNMNFGKFFVPETR